MDVSKVDPQLALEKVKSVEPITDQVSEDLSDHEKQQISDDVADDFPDGGLKAWSVAIGTSLVLFCTMGMINTYGVFQAYYQTHQLADVSPSDISWIGSLQVFFLFSSALVGGPLFDRYGAKVIHPAIVVYIFSLMMTSISKKYWQFMLSQGLLAGLANGMTMAPALSVVPQYFKKKRGAAMGLVVAGSSLGGVILPIISGKMLYSSLGFGWSVRVLGFVFAALLAFSAAVLRARLPPRKSNFLLPRAFKDMSYTFLIVSCFFMLLGVFIPIFYLPLYAESHGMSPTLASYLLSILNAASFMGRVIPGVLSDKLGALNVLSVAGISSGILIFCWPSTTTNASIIVFAAIFGFCSGGVVSGMSLGLSSCARNPRDFGTYLGMGMAILAIPTLISPPINGAMVNHFHDFNQAAYFSGAMTLFGGLLAIVTKAMAADGFAWRS